MQNQCVCAPHLPQHHLQLIYTVHSLAAKLQHHHQGIQPVENHKEITETSWKNNIQLTILKLQKKTKAMVKAEPVCSFVQNHHTLCSFVAGSKASILPS